MSIFARLLILTLIAVLPALAIQANNELDLRKAREQEVRESALRNAAFASGELDRIVESGHSLLVAIATLPAVVDRDADQCSAYLRGLKASFDQYLLIGVLDREGRAFCTSVGPRPDVSMAERPFFRVAIDTGEFTVGLYSAGGVVGTDVLPLIQPFRDRSGDVAGIVYASLDPAWLATHFKDRPLNADTTLAIADRNGRIVVRIPDNEKYAGALFADAYLPYVKATTPGTDEILGIDGVARILGYVPAEAALSHLYVGVGIAKDAAFASVNRASNIGFGLIASGLLLAFFSAWFGGRYFLTKPVENLAAKATQWSKGKFDVRAGLESGTSEIVRLGATFDLMAEKLEALQRENTHLVATLEQQVAERTAALNASEARIRTFFDYSSEGHCVMVETADGRFLYEEINPALARLYNKLRDQVIGLSTVEILGATLAALVDRHLSECLRTGLPTRYVRQHANSVLEVIVAQVPGSGDRLRRVVVSARDITVSRHLEEQLRQSQKMEAVGQLTGGIAHDFNNLLQVVIGNLDNLRRHSQKTQAPSPAETIQRFIDAAMRGAQRAAILTQQLLAFSRRQPLDPKPTDIGGLITGIVELLRSTLGERIHIETNLPDNLWRVTVDANQLESALLNLAVNARDAIPAGGKLGIAASNLDSEAAALADPELAGGEYILIAVKDTGAGMTEEIASRAFDPFFTTKEVGHGTGLGLSQVYGFVAQSGGQVKIVSRPGAGTTVKLYLPVTRNAP